jgi:hypothetical protein
MARRRYLAKKMHAVKIRHAHEKLALFRQGKLKFEQLPALARRILQKGLRGGQGPVVAPPEKAAAHAERKEKPKSAPTSGPQATT